VTHALCRIYGDPHIHTFDGKKIDFQGGCEYLAVNSSELVVTVLFNKDARVTSSLAGVTASVSGNTVELYRGGERKVC